MLIAPPIGIAVLLLLPFLSGEGEKSWRRRPIAVLTVLLLAVMLGTFTRLASYTPWSPEMNAWSGFTTAGALSQGQVSARAAGRTGVSGQTVPQLSCTGR